MSNYNEMWRSLGLNMAAHDQLLQMLPPTYHDVYLTQPNRQQGIRRLLIPSFQSVHVVFSKCEC
ncbi:hypothetical protein [Desulfoscipio gibsoniae]